MADPLSLAASAAGLLSLSIQVTQGISTYLNALKGRREDLDAVHRKNDALGRILDSVKSTVSSPQPLNRPHAAVADCIATCEGELVGLETLVAQLAGCKNAQTWKARLQNQSKKLSYPFKQSKVQQLSQRLDQVNGTLQVALGGLGIHIAQRSQQTLEGVATSIHDFSGDFRFVRSEVASIRQCSKESNTLQRDHLTMSNSLLTIVSTTQNHNTDLIAQNSELIAEIGNLRKLLVTQKRGSTSQHPSRVTPAQAVFRIARSPPSQLKKLCDDLGGPDGINLAVNGNDSSVCLCTAHGRKDKRDSTHWGFLLLYHERSGNAHQPHCPWAKKTKKFGLGLFGLTKVLQVAIDVSFTLSSGAGGWSLSQNFTYYPTVDWKTDPVFLALDRFMTSRQQNIQLYGFDQENETVMELLRGIKQAYTEGRSTPTAVDFRNCTPLHHFFDYYYAFGVSNWEAIYKTLRSFGVPVTSYNLNGWTCLSGLPWNAEVLKFRHQSTAALSTIIQSEFAGIPVNLNAGSAETGPHLLKVLDMSPILAEAYGCGPMSLAVLANDSEEVKRLLASQPNSVLEQNSAGQTPLHLAANKPSCLELLVSTSTDSLLNQRDGSGTSALEYAMQMSSSRCADFFLGPHKCSRCHCAKCVAILLNADCEVPFGTMLHHLCLEHASERARRRFVSHLRNRRQRLLQLAQSQSSIISIGRLPLAVDKLPDANAPLIVELLRLSKVIIPPALDVPTSGGMFKPIFHILSDKRSANLFFRNGFRDIDSSTNGRTPLTARWGWKRHPEYLQWLIDNGADISRLLVPSRQMPGSTDIRGTFVTHSILYKIGSWVFKSDFRERAQRDRANSVNNLISMILPLSVQDSCICACSNESCTPLVYLLKSIRTDVSKKSLWRSNILEHKAELIVQNFEPLDDAIDVKLQLSSIRWITFEALEFTHTCCNPEEVLSSGNYPTGTETDDLPLEGEDPEVLESFEQMVGELQEAAHNTYAATSSLVHFWTNIWAPRVRKEMDKLMGTNLNQKEREDSEAIGVKWHHQPQPEEQSVCVATGNPYRWGTWESAEWKDRQLDPLEYLFEGLMRPRASAFQSFGEGSSEGSGWTTESYES